MKHEAARTWGRERMRLGWQPSPSASDSYLPCRTDLPHGSPAGAFIAAGLVGGAAMGLTVATITGVALVRMLSPVVNGGDSVR